MNENTYKHTLRDLKVLVNSHLRINPFDFWSFKQVMALLNVKVVDSRNKNEEPRETTYANYLSSKDMYLFELMLAKGSDCEILEAYYTFRQCVERDKHLLITE